MSEIAREAAESLWTGLGRRDFVRAVAALSAGAGVAGVASGCSSGGSTSTPSAARARPGPPSTPAQDRRLAASSVCSAEIPIDMLCPPELERVPTL